MYKCKIKNPACAYSSNSVKSYVSHCTNCHCAGTNASFLCGYRTCSRRFKSYSAFSSHIYRDHGKKASSKNIDHCISSSIDEFVCKHCASQSPQFNSIVELTSHLKFHFDGNTNVICPYKGCTKEYLIFKSFTSHLCRYHGNKQWLDFNRAQVQTIESEYPSAYDNDSRLTSPVDTSQVDFQHNNETGSDRNSKLAVAEHKNAFVKNLALFYLTLNSKHHVTQGVTQLVHDQFKSMINKTVEMVAQDINQRLSSHIEHDLLKKIVHEVCSETNDSIIYSSKGDPLRTQHARRQFFEKEFAYNRPIEISLGLNSLNYEAHMHYVPILESLTTFLSNGSVYEQWYFNLHTARSSNTDVMTDIHDGLKMKAHPLFSTDKSALQIILFQDEFLIANPLGSSKKNLKMLGVYYTLGNIYPWHRSKVDPLQLVLLCKSKDLKHLGQLGQEMVFGPLIKDLKILERRGITVRGETVRGSVAFIAGDNLGSHFIGGFVENFSTSQYFCRFCNIERGAFHDGQMFGIQRTEESYNTTLTALNIDLVTSVVGIKRCSLFNTLDYFHVIDGLPPCIGHDLFEGMAQYDLPLAFNYFQQKGWFTCNELNRRIECFHYKGLSSNDKPCPVSSTGKLGGHAVQTWTLIRLLPLLIADKIIEKGDPVWKMILDLIVIVQIACSPKITRTLIALLSEKIESYIEARRNIFPNKLRPKHHYIAHYPRLILQYGPLIRLWTMRFKSKHKYFKDCQRSSKNVINVTKTLSEKHQLLQAGYSENCHFFQEALMEKGTEYNGGLFSEQINQAILDAKLTASQLRVCDNATFRGTTYSKNQIVVLDSYVNLNMLKINVLLVKDESEIHLIGEKITGMLLENVQLYELEKSNEKCMICCPIQTLQDYHSYNIYDKTIFPFPVISLKHLTN